MIDFSNNIILLHSNNLKQANVFKTNSFEKEVHKKEKS